jgi:hypothetical protein
MKQYRDVTVVAHIMCFATWKSIIYLNKISDASDTRYQYQVFTVDSATNQFMDIVETADIRTAYKYFDGRIRTENREQWKQYALSVGL